MELYEPYNPNIVPKEPKPINVTSYKSKNMKKEKKKIIDEKMKVYAETIGVDDNDNYPKFEEN